MVFNSFTFVIFFIIVTVLYFWLPYKHRWKMLLVASYIFYMTWSVKYSLLLAASTAITFISGLAIEKFPRYKRSAVAISIISNIGILILFKYANFSIEIANGIFKWVGTSTQWSYLDLMLPVGISFYIFQALSYTIDVYKGRIGVEKNFFFYALFVSFFPQLVAGPIEKASHLLPQLKKNFDFSYDRARDGLQLVIWGMFKKVVIANRLAIYVDQVYNNVGSFGPVELTMASIMFAFQIYCDFSGYSDIAIGIARVMGYDLMKNFNRPYFARSIGDFWHRWHISLSTWFQQYLYIPLGGNRVSVPRHYFNLFFTFLVSGIWHGANWTFIAWGALHGLVLVLEAIFKRIKNPSVRKNPILDSVKVVWVFFIVVFAWIFFRANNITDAFTIIRTIAGGAGEFINVQNWVEFWGGLKFATFNNTVTHAVINSLIIFSVFLLIFMQWLHKDDTVVEYLNKKPIWARWIFNYVVIITFLLAGLFDNSQFIYFSFKPTTILP